MDETAGGRRAILPRFWFALAFEFRDGLPFVDFHAKGGKLFCLLCFHLLREHSTRCADEIGASRIATEFPVEPQSPGGATPNVSPGRKTWVTFPNDNYPEPCKGGTKQAALYFSAYTPLFRFPRTHFPTSNRQANKGRGSPRLRESQPDEQRKNITPRLRLAVVSSPRAIGKYKISDKGLATRH